MAIESEAEKAAEAIGTDEDEMIVFTDAVVKSDGRITVPKSSRDRHGIDVGDYVDVILVAKND